MPVKFSAYELQTFMPTRDARVEMVRYHYTDEKQTFQHEITATNAVGEEVRLRLL